MVLNNEQHCIVFLSLVGYVLVRRARKHSL